MHAASNHVSSTFQIELERRPRAAKRLGLWKPPARAVPTKLVDEVEAKEPADQLQLSTTFLQEIERRPRAAKRLGPIDLTIPQDMFFSEEMSNEIASGPKSYVDTASGRDEMARLPYTAQRLGLLPKQQTSTPIPSPGIPLIETALYQDEAERLPRTARRYGLLETSDVTADASVLQASRKPFLHTATGHTEAERRPRAAARLLQLSASKSAEKQVTVGVAAAPLKDTMYYAEEAARRPRCMARQRRVAQQATGDADEDYNVPAFVHPELLEGDLHYLDDQLSDAMDALSLDAVYGDDFADESALSVFDELDTAALNDSFFSSRVEEVEGDETLQGLERMLAKMIASHHQQQQAANSEVDAINDPYADPNTAVSCSMTESGEVVCKTTANNVVIMRCTTHEHGKTQCDLLNMNGQHVAFSV